MRYGGTCGRWSVWRRSQSEGQGRKGVLALAPALALALCWGCMPFAYPSHPSSLAVTTYRRNRLHRLHRPHRLHRLHRRFYYICTLFTPLYTLFIVAYFTPSHPYFSTARSTVVLIHIFNNCHSFTSLLAITTPGTARTTQQHPLQ